MSVSGLVAARNLEDIEDINAAWNSLGNKFSYTINGVTTSNAILKGKDIFAIQGLVNVPLTSLLYLKDLASPAQPRISQIALSTNSALALRSIAFPKSSPVSSGTFSITGALTASSLQINGVAVKGISGSPFSGGVASTPIELGGLACGTSFKLNVATSVESIATPSLVVPIDADGMTFYLKAGVA